MDTATCRRLRQRQSAQRGTKSPGPEWGSAGGAPTRRTMPRRNAYGRSYLSKRKRYPGRVAAANVESEVGAQGPE